MTHNKLGIKEFFRTLYHRTWVRVLISTALILLLPLVGVYAILIEPFWVQIVYLKLPIQKFKGPLKPLRLVQMSDLHFGPTHHSEKHFKKCMQMANDLKPDVLVLTGDYLQWDEEYVEGLGALLKELKAGLGVFATLGNHDYGVCHAGEGQHDPIDYQNIISIFTKNGIRVLHNDFVTLKRNEFEFNLVGIGDFWTPHFKPEVAFEKVDRAKPTILLSHNPDSLVKLKNYKFEIMLAGHVHGGQISLPLIGPLAIPVKNRKWRRDLHHVFDRRLYTNRGLGYTFQARFLSRPEITCLDLVSA